MPRQRRSETVATLLGRRVRDLRAARGWTQERLAEEVELDRSYVAGIEVGGRNPSLKALARFADAFRISLTDLFRF